MQLSDGRDIIARIANCDINNPNFDGFTLGRQVNDVEFEATIYSLLKQVTKASASQMIYYRIPILYDSPQLSRSQKILGRRLFLFEKAAGTKNVWRGLSKGDQVMLST